jgi:hypothetical protein
MSKQERLTWEGMKLALGLMNLIGPKAILYSLGITIAKVLKK